MTVTAGWSAIAFGLAIAAAIPAPALAQTVDSSMTLYGRVLALNPPEQARLLDLQHVLHGSNRGAQDRALAAAQAIVTTADARLLLAVYQLEIGRQRQDDALRAAALDVLIASRDIPRDRIPGYLGLRGDIAFRSRDYATAATLWTRLAELQPNDPQTLMNLAQLRDAQGESAAAADLVQRAIAARRNAAQPPPETWYRQWVAIAHNARLADRGVAAAHALLAAYPTPDNWRFALVAYRQLAAPQASAEIDLLRLMRAAGAFARPAEYQRLAQLLEHAGLALEGKAVLDEGVARAILSRDESPTREIIAEVDRAIPRQQGRALTPETGDLRRGVVLALAGRRGEAETAFRAAAANADGSPAGGWSRDLARFWLLWLAQSVRR